MQVCSKCGKRLAPRHFTKSNPTTCRACLPTIKCDKCKKVYPTEHFPNLQNYDYTCITCINHINSIAHEPPTEQPIPTALFISYDIDSNTLTSFIINKYDKNSCSTMRCYKRSKIVETDDFIKEYAQVILHYMTTHPTYIDAIFIDRGYIIYHLIKELEIPNHVPQLRKHQITHDFIMRKHNNSI